MRAWLGRGEKASHAGPRRGAALASGLDSPGLMRALGLLCLALLVAGCDSEEDCATQTCTSTDAFAFDDITSDGTTPGAQLEVGDCFTVDYVGRLADGSGTFDEGTLTRFFDGRAGLIQGFLLGMVDQRVRETRRVTIPPASGYGACPLEQGPAKLEQGYVDIPACSTLEFDITLVRINQDTRLCTGGL